MFVLCFQLKSHMSDSVFPELLSNPFFDLMRFAVCYNVHGGIVVLTVHAPNMNMVNV